MRKFSIKVLGGILFEILSIGFQVLITSFDKYGVMVSLISRNEMKNLETYVSSGHVSK